MRQARNALFLLLATAMAAQAADTSPYFRFQYGASPPGKPGSAEPGTNDGGTTAPPASLDLSFAQASPVVSGQTGAPRAGTYRAAGGSAPYTMTLAGAPPTLTLSPDAPDGSSWVLSGDLGPSPGTFRRARITLTDASSAQTSYAIPLDVSAPSADQPNPPPLSVGGDDLPPSFNANSQTYATATASGGAPPYAWSLSGAPQTMAFSGYSHLPTASTVQVNASIPTPAHYEDVTLTVTDSKGQTASRKLAPFDVVTGNALATLAVEPVPTPPATLQAGATWTSGPFHVSGGSGTGYNAYLSGGPSSDSFSVQQDPADPSAFRLTLAPGPADIGRYANMMVVARDDQGASTLAQVGSVSVPAPAPLALAAQTGPLSVDPGSFDPHVNGSFKGGSGTYTIEAFGNPPDFSFYLYAYDQASASGDGSRDVMMIAYATSPGTWRDLLVVVTDAGTGQRLELGRFDVTVGDPGTVAGGPITSCTSVWGSPPMTINSGDTMNHQDGIHVNGGEAPFAVSYNPGAIPSQLGFSIDASKPYPLATGVSGITLRLAPTAPGQFDSVPVVVTDSKGSSCTVALSALVNPKGTGY